MFEKCYEEHIRRHLKCYLDTNKIILKQHHGGLARHSTLSAKSLIDYRIGEGIDCGKSTVILSTDLSAAYDTVDHCILVRKLHHYGIRNKELDLIKSYLTERFQFVELEGKRSEVTNCLASSVIQGSKLSGIFLRSLYK